MYFNRREIVQAGVRSFVVVEGEVTLQVRRRRERVRPPRITHYSSSITHYPSHGLIPEMQVTTL